MSQKFSRRLALLVMTTTATTSIMPTYGVNSLMGSEKTISEEIQSTRQITTGGALTTTGSTIQVDPVQGNLVKNFSFESEMGGHPSQWGTLSNISSGKVPQVSLDTDVKISGSKSLKLEATQDNTRGFYNQRIEVEPNTTYSLEAWVKTQNVNTAPFGVQMQTVKGSTLQPGTPSTIEKKGTSDWTHEKYEFTTDAQTTAVILRIALGTTYGATKGSTAWIDDLVLKKVENIKEVTGIELQHNLTI